MKTTIAGRETTLRTAAASNGHAAVLVIELPGSGVSILRYAPKNIDLNDYRVLINRAASKLGYKRDRRCRFGWRKLAK